MRKPKDRAGLTTGIALSVAALAIAVAAPSVRAANINIPLGNYPDGTQATAVWTGNGYTLQGGDIFLLQSTNDPDLVNYKTWKDWYKWFFDTRTFRDSDTGATLGSGQIYSVDHVHTTPSKSNPSGDLTKNNGYTFVGSDKVKDWVSAMRGNWDYVQSQLQNAVFNDRDAPSITMNLYDLPTLELLCGAAPVEDGEHGTWYHSSIYVTDPASGSLSLSDNTVTYGEPLKITTTARIGAYHAIYHLELVQILDASGHDVTESVLGPYGSENLAGSVPTGHFLYINGMLMTEVSGGGPSSIPGPAQTWKHTTTIDTSKLPPGKYTVRYWVRDWFDRGTPDDQPMTATFTVQKITGSCPAPYDTDVHWVNLGNGDQELVWTHHQPTPQYDQYGNFTGCVDQTTQMSKKYTHTVEGQISGLSYDPGTPNDMWLPVPAAQWNPYQGASSIWGPLDAKHDWTGLETGGPDANQISSNVWIDGELFHTYGPPIGTQTPTVWVRAGGGFGFRYVWNGSPDAIPTGGTVTFTMTNPDGGSITWTKPLILNTETLYTAGTNLVGLDQPPPEASVVFSCWTDIPKGVYKNGQPEEAAWSLSNDWQTAYNNGAHISVSITVDTPAGSFTVSAPNVASTFSYPAWWFTRLASDNLLQDMQKWQQSLQLGTIYGDPSVGLPQATGTH